MAAAMEIEVARIVGVCADCRREDLPGSKFVLGELQRFLAEMKTARGSVDVRSEMRAVALTQVAGESLRCRGCSVRARDSASGLAWEVEHPVTVELKTRPFGIVRVDSASSYIVSRADGTAAGKAGVRPGWRCVAVGGADVRGEPAGTVRQAIKDGALPLSLAFERPSAEWPPCGRCGHACQPGRSRCLREECVAAEEEEVEEGRGGDAALAMVTGEGQSGSEAVAVADSWEDF